MQLRKCVVGALLAGWMIFGAAVAVSSASPQSQSTPPSQNAMTVSGKVSAIGSDHKSLSLEVSGGNTMQFLLDNNTQVQGRVSTGTIATVQYQKTDDGKYLALNVAMQTSDNSPQPQQ